MKRKLTVFGLIAFLTIPFTVAVSTSINQKITPVDVEGYNDKVNDAFNDGQFLYANDSKGELVTKDIYGHTTGG